MNASCARCGASFVPRQVSSRFCSPQCRKDAYRARRKGEPEAVAQVVAFPVVAGTSVAQVARGELAAAGRLETHLGQAALALAERIDNARAVMGFAQLVREFRVTMAEAVRDADDESDALDAIRQSAALKLIAGDAG